MRFPIPQRFKTSHVAIFAVGLFTVQQLEGTEIVFSSLSALYIALTACAFNVAGGFDYPSGAWIFFNAVGSVLLGIVYKAFLLQPGHTHLFQPDKMMLIYCAGMAGMLLAAALNRRLRPRHGLLASSLKTEAMNRAAFGCLALGIFIEVISRTGDEGSVASALRQLNRLPQMAIILATTYAIARSGGRSSTNWIVYVAGGYMLVLGLLDFSKEGMFVAFVTWLIPAIALRYDFSFKQVVIGVAVVWFMLMYLVPYSQYGRQSRDASGRTSAKADAALGYITDLQGTRDAYLASGEVTDLNGPHFFDDSEGLFDREQMLAFDDALVNYTDQGNVFGLAPTYEAFINIVPHFIWKNKPNFASGNHYGREIGVLDDEDTSTGISFSPTGDAYHQAEWAGVLLLIPLTIFLYFFITDGLVGNVRESPWPLLPIAMISHVAPQGLLSGQIYLMTYGSVAIILISLLARYVMPIFGGLLTGTEKTQVRKGRTFLPLPGGGPVHAVPPADAQSSSA